MKPGHRNAGRWIWLAVVLVKPINTVFFKRRWRGREHIPPTGGIVRASRKLMAGGRLAYVKSACHVTVIGFGSYTSMTSG